MAPNLVLIVGKAVSGRGKTVPYRILTVSIQITSHRERLSFSGLLHDWENRTCKGRGAAAMFKYGVQATEGLGWVPHGELSRLQVTEPKKPGLHVMTFVITYCKG
jgi:hypothetical protein